MDSNEISDTYEGLPNLNELLSHLLSRVSGTTTDPVRSLERYQTIVADKCDEFGAAQATRTTHKISEYRNFWGGELPTLETAGLTPTERDFLELLNIVSPGEPVRIPVGPESGKRLPIVVTSDTQVREAETILDEFQLPVEETTILHLSDTHLGFHLRGSHSQAGGSIPPWNEELQPMLAFKEALSIAMGRDVDAVLHTGDLFDHNVDRSTLEAAKSALLTLHASRIPFYCILGDHDRNATGGTLPGDVNAIAGLQELVHEGAVTELTTHPTRIGSVALYGISASNLGMDDILMGGIRSGSGKRPRFHSRLRLRM